MLEDVKKNAELKMQKSLESLKNDLAKVRTGRAHVGLLDHVMVEYYGSMVAVNQVANVNLGDSRTINVQPYEKNMIAKVEKAIRDSDLGLNPATNGDLIRVPMPMLTEERRRDLTKIVRTEGEGAKVAIRNVRRDANDALKKLVKDKAISEDDERRAQDEVQKATDKAVAEVDKMLQVKETDLMAV
ncbi:MAG: ribosome-recycling factor [Methylotenera sp.]|jgi:ribosome recycling factor|uniref:Ribosome-recycling factor n=1 Tax=Methylotenera mobilis TaxID=359408 RepID=A0A351RA01_9PROT|nr:MULTISPECIES: ribosome recycling factor [Methylotenera]MDP3211649.1 ribosome recycling factor [Methylotenera sp.]MDP3776242.1 ribosome recycling factor [Methylotenera sp.]PPC96224.1 MAG: ribosome-recycling factor [Methylotenera sp.]HBA08872.1 ribosome recycling factor [Methylotenera mobilis]